MYRTTKVSAVVNKWICNASIHLQRVVSEGSNNEVEVHLTLFFGAPAVMRRHEGDVKGSEIVDGIQNQTSMREF